MDEMHASTAFAKLRDVKYVVPKPHDSVPGAIRTDETQKSPELSAESHDSKVEEN